MAEQLQLVRVDYHIEENWKIHLTEEYSSKQVSPELENINDNYIVLRRARDYMLSIIFDREVLLGDEIFIEFVYANCENPRVTKGTKSPLMPIRGYGLQPGPWAGWSVNVKEEEQCTPEMRCLDVRVPRNTKIGKWRLNVYIGDMCSTTFVCKRLAKDIYIIFDPFEELPGDVYTKCEKLVLNDETEDYVFNDAGSYQSGNAKCFFNKPWYYGQFERSVLPITVAVLMDDPEFEVQDRHLQEHWVRAICRAISLRDDKIIGLWYGDQMPGAYTDETHPSVWLSSPEILEQYWSTGRQSVHYGQHHVCAGLATTMCRTLGIASEMVTIFNWALNVQDYDEHENGMELVEYWDCEGKCDPSQMAGMQWQSYVFSRVYIPREVRGERFDPALCQGWHLINAACLTPVLRPERERHAVEIPTGPALIEGIQRSYIRMNYDVDFFHANINATVLHVIDAQPSGQVYILERNKFGAAIISKLPRMSTVPYKGEKAASDVNVLTAMFHYRPLSMESCYYESGMQVYGYSDGANVIEKEDVEVKCYPMFTKPESRGHVLGDAVTFLLEIKNTNEEECRKVRTSLHVNVITTDGQMKEMVHCPFNFEDIIQASEKIVQKAIFPPTSFLKLQDPYGFRLSAMVRVTETRQICILHEDFHLRKPNLDMKVKLAGSKACGRILMTLTNPLPCDLTECTVHVVAPMLFPGVSRIKVGVLKSRDTAELEQRFTHYDDTVTYAMACFDSKEIKDIKNMIYINGDRCSNKNKVLQTDEPLHSGEPVFSQELGDLSRRVSRLARCYELEACTSYPETRPVAVSGIPQQNQEHAGEGDEIEVTSLMDTNSCIS